MGSPLHTIVVRAKLLTRNGTYAQYRFMKSQPWHGHVFPHRSQSSQSYFVVVFLLNLGNSIFLTDPLFADPFSIQLDQISFKLDGENHKCS